MVTAAIIAAVGGVGAAAISSHGASSAANTQANAANNASQTQLQMFEQMRTGLKPYTDAGTTSLGALTNFMGINPDGTRNPNAPGVKPFSPTDLTSDPGYQFRLKEGNDAIMNQRSAMGGVLSGATLKDLTNFSQGTASQEFQQAWQRYNYENNNQFDRLYNLTSMGENAAAGVGTAGVNTGAAIGANTIGAGNAIAAGQVGSANAVSGGISNLYQQWLMSQMFQNPGGGATPVMQLGELGNMGPGTYG